MFINVAVNAPLYRTMEYQCKIESAIDETSMPLFKKETTNKQEFKSANESSDKDASGLDLIGCRVLISIGNRRNILGVITEIHEKSTLPENIKVKCITKFADEYPLFSNSIMELLSKAANYYHYPIGEAFYTAVPAALKKGEPAAIPFIEGWTIINADSNINREQQLHRSKKSYRALTILKEASLSTLALKEIGFSKTILNKLASLGFIKKINMREQFIPWTTLKFKEKKGLELNHWQSDAVNSVINSSGFHTFLLYGVTGSGKTEVYLQIINNCLKKGKQALVLVPEINLTPQTVNRFYNRFSVPIVCIHSSLNATERLESFLMIKRNEAAILIGTRSALFTPMPSLGIIIVDEEHDSSYRQEDGFRYNARDLAVMRASIENIPIILGSATPSIESIQNVKFGKYIELSLPERAGNAHSAEISLIDMRFQPIQHGLSLELLNRIKIELHKNNQILIMLNRRGYAPKLICHHCGYVFTCDHCDANLCLHHSSNCLICHHCETKFSIPKTCPKCGSTELVPTGNGTEQIYNYLMEIFPNVPIVRIDRDTTSKKGSLEKYLEGIQNGDYKILIGTQMLAKGHDFPNVTLVAIIDIDNCLFANDFRAEENVAQLLIQTAGRAGRAEKPGKVVIQTHVPNNPLITLLINQGYTGFLEKALIERKNLKLPPFSAQAALKADSLNKGQLSTFIDNAFYFIKKLAIYYPGITYSYPHPPFVEKTEDHYRMQIIIQATGRKELSLFLNKLINNIDKFKQRNKCHCIIELDPRM